MDEASYWLGFSVFPGVGPAKFGLLLDHFQSARDAWHGSENDLKQVIGPALTGKFLDFRDRFSIENYKAQLTKKAVSFLTLSDENYPKLLKRIKDPPFVLYTKGSQQVLSQTQNTSFVSIVGTRKITSYGREVTEMITRELVSAGCVIVSGLALGVDAIAHKTTIENEGRTIAVLGSDVDSCTPRENQRLYDGIIASGGVIVSEFPLGQVPSVGSFPSRNRIIAGLSHAVAVTEGAADSGALYTAEYAFENDRPVFAVPGPITSSLSKGPNGLLAKGAKLVTSGKDILDLLGVTNQARQITHDVIQGENDEEQKIIDLLQNEPMHIDLLVKQTGIPISDMSVLLSLMEVKGMVKSLDTGLFSIAH